MKILHPLFEIIFYIGWSLCSFVLTPLSKVKDTINQVMDADCINVKRHIFDNSWIFLFLMKIQQLADFIQMGLIWLVDFFCQWFDIWSCNFCRLWYSNAYSGFKFLLNFINCVHSCVAAFRFCFFYASIGSAAVLIDSFACTFLEH